MAIYISGVKNLPEQVQKNKDDIEDLHTADTNLDAKIDQEIADRKALIEASGNATIIENPTENVAVSLTESETNRNFVVFIDGTPKLNIDEANIVANEDTAVNGDLEVYGNITATGDLQVANITASGDITTHANLQGRYVKATQEIVAKHITTPTDESFLQFTAYDSSQNPHVMQFSGNSQELTIDGNEVGGKQLYQHNVYVNGQVGARYYWVFLSIINDNNNPFTDFAGIKNYINDNYPAYNKGLSCSGYIYDGSNDLVAVNVYKGASNNSFSIQYISPAGHNISSYEYFSSATNVADQVLPI